MWPEGTGHTDGVLGVLQGPALFHVEFDEHVAACAVRETKEETNLDIRLDGVFGVYMALDDPRTSVVLVLYKGTRVGGELRAGDDAIDAGFFPLDQLPGGIAFLAHKLALADLRRGS